MAQSGDDAVSDSIETLLWTCKDCYVYQIPPLKNENGHRANDWDVNKWLWQGALKLTARGSTLNIILHDPTTSELFATCPVEEQGSKAVDQVMLPPMPQAPVLSALHCNRHLRLPVCNSSAALAASSRR